MVLGLGLVWTVLIRVPLIVNAEDHLDSDLAVDGLTLIDAVHGHWRWHYPGTPHMGILPMFFSYPQAPGLGGQCGHAGERRNVDLASDRGERRSGWRGRRTVRRSRAGRSCRWSFRRRARSGCRDGSPGGHLLTLVWHTWRSSGLHACLSKGPLRAVALGLWCGLGLYLDMMFLFTLFGLVPAAVLGWFFGGRWRLKLGTIAGVRGRGDRRVRAS